jgi:hypothetical protein
MARRGTRAKIDLTELEKLCMLQCTDQEIGFWFGVTTRTIGRRRKLRAFREAMERGQAKGRISMRRAQLRILENGNATMAIWLGKQYLGQTDEIGVNGLTPMLVIAHDGLNHAPPEVLPQITGASDIAERGTLDISPEPE